MEAKTEIFSSICQIFKLYYKLRPHILHIFLLYLVLVLIILISQGFLWLPDETEKQNSLNWLISV
jgi:hypothetical protein